MNKNPCEIINDYYRGLKTLQIFRKHGIGWDYYNNLLKEYTVVKRFHDVRNTKKRITTKMFEREFHCEYNKNNGTYKIKCAKCDVYKSIQRNAILNAKKANKRYECGDCFYDKDSLSIKHASSKRRNSNTSGYIGVCYLTRRNKTTMEYDVVGYQAYLMYKGRRLLANKYKDHYLHKKTLIQAAVDRDLFIIEKKLPHTRNFKDSELMGKMEYLGYAQLEEFKNKVRANKII